MIIQPCYESPQVKHEKILLPQGKHNSNRISTKATPLNMISRKEPVYHHSPSPEGAHASLTTADLHSLNNKAHHLIRWTIFPQLVLARALVKSFMAFEIATASLFLERLQGVILRNQIYGGTQGPT